MEIGHQILIDRRSAGLTQEEVAKSVNSLQRVTLRDIERGLVTPSEELAQAILDAIERLKVKP